MKFSGASASSDVTNRKRRESRGRSANRPLGPSGEDKSHLSQSPKAGGEQRGRQTNETNAAHQDQETETRERETDAPNQTNLLYRPRMLPPTDEVASSPPSDEERVIALKAMRARLVE